MNTDELLRVNKLAGPRVAGEGASLALLRAFALPIVRPLAAAPSNCARHSILSLPLGQLRMPNAAAPTQTTGRQSSQRYSSLELEQQWRRRRRSAAKAREHSCRLANFAHSRRV